MLLNAKVWVFNHFIASNSVMCGIKYCRAGIEYVATINNNSCRFRKSRDTKFNLYSNVHTHMACKCKMHQSKRDICYMCGLFEWVVSRECRLEVYRFVNKFSEGVITFNNEIWDGTRAEHCLSFLKLFFWKVFFFFF
jgi:hypothetical protein